MHFGHGRKLPSIETRHAETFMVTRKRLDGRDGKLSSWALAHHLRRCRAIFNAAVTWLAAAHGKPAPTHGIETPARALPHTTGELEAELAALEREYGQGALGSPG